MSRCLFVTGKLAAQSLRDTLNGIQPLQEYECAVLPISVAALMDTRYVAKHLAGAMGCDTVMIPGLCAGDVRPIEDRLGVEVIRGPKCLKDIPGYFGKTRRLEGYGAYRTKIIAEIVDAYRLSTEAILERAIYYRDGGADVIDLGGPVEGGFRDIANAVKALKAEGFLVSVDSFNEEDILNADRAGVDFLLSVNSRDMELAPRLRCKVVVIPDFEKGLESLERNISQLEEWGVPYIIDPVLKPIGFGLAESIGDYITVRRKHPQAEMLMGVGNVTELTGADSTGITALMAGIIAELGIDYVLTTEVIPWARGAVREMDIARRLMHYACRNKMLPKHLDDGLITIKDPQFETYREDELRAMQKKVRDRNFRIFADLDSIYVFNNKSFIKDTDIQAIFDQLDMGGDVSQAFYLGRELQKAALAVKLGKRYVQEEDLRWGYLSSKKFTAETQRAQRFTEK
jgi:dihydropteroate synthase-like protein